MQTATATSERSDQIAPRSVRIRWNEEETQILHDNYLARGVRACGFLLPGRSHEAIMEKAHQMGLLRSPHAKPAESTPAIDEAIRRAYLVPVTRRSGHERLNHKGIGKLAERIGRTRQWIHSRAMRLGYTKSKMAMEWCAEEIRIIEDAEGIGVGAIRKRLKKAGYSRTPGAIQGWAEKHALKLNDENPDHYSANNVADLLGCAHSSVLRWIESGKLKAERAGEQMKWNIHKKDLREFMIEHQSLWDHRKVQQQWWLIEILTGRIARVV